VVAAAGPEQGLGAVVERHHRVARAQILHLSGAVRRVDPRSGGETQDHPRLERHERHRFGDMGGFAVGGGVLLEAQVDPVGAEVAEDDVAGVGLVLRLGFGQHDRLPNEAPRSSGLPPAADAVGVRGGPELPSPPACTAIQPTFSSPWMPSRRSASSTLSVKPPAVIAVGSLSTWGMGVGGDGGQHHGRVGEIMGERHVLPVAVGLGVARLDQAAVGQDMGAAFDGDPVDILHRRMRAVVVFPFVDGEGEPGRIAVGVGLELDHAKRELVAAVVGRRQRDHGIGQRFGEGDRIGSPS
jgi:hypothetical protein